MKGLSGRLSRFGPQPSCRKENLLPETILCADSLSQSSSSRATPSQNGSNKRPLEQEAGLEQALGAVPARTTHPTGEATGTAGVAQSRKGVAEEEPRLSMSNRADTSTARDIEMVGCPVCGDPLTTMDVPARQFHINSCLDGRSSAGASSSDGAAMGEPPDRGIAEWLDKLGLSKYTLRFHEEQIGVECLPLLSEHDLQALGVASAVDRARIAKSIYMQAQALRPFKEQQSREGDEGSCSGTSSGLLEPADKPLLQAVLGKKRPNEQTLSRGKKPAKEGRRLADGLLPQAMAGESRKSSNPATSPKQSSYSRDSEGNLLAALFEGHDVEPQREDQKAQVQGGEGEAGKLTLWHCASYSSTAGPPATPLQERIARAKASKLVPDKSGVHASKSARPVERHAPKPEMKRGPASSSQPTSHSIQLHALQTELAAAEANVMELKRLIAELESQGGK